MDPVLALVALVPVVALLGPAALRFGADSRDAGAEGGRRDWR